MNPTDRPDPHDASLAGLSLHDRSFNVQRRDGLKLSAASINSVPRHDLRGRAHLVELLCWNADLKQADTTQFQGVFGIPEALRLMADFMAAATTEEALTTLRNAGRRKGLNQVTTRPEVPA